MLRLGVWHESTVTLYTWGCEEKHTEPRALHGGYRFKQHEHSPGIITEMKDSKVAAGEQASLLSRTGLHVALATSGLSRRHGTPDHSI
jgi:hypothetical protein